jgi:CRP-like cAMP-binding protein
MKNLEELVPLGTESSSVHAARLKGGSVWTSYAARESGGEGAQSLPLGTAILLSRPKKELKLHPDSESALWFSFPFLKIPVWLENLTLIVLFLIVFPPFLFGQSLIADSPYMESGHLLNSLLYALGFYVLLSAWEAGVIARYFTTKSKVAGFSIRGISPEPITWKLVSGKRIGHKLLLFGLLVMLLGFSWHSYLPSISSGLVLGSWFWFVFALYPLKYGPGVSTLEMLLGVKDIPSNLLWTLAGRFLPLGQKIQSKSKGNSMSIAALALALWIVVAGYSFDWIRFSIKTSGSANVIWESICDLFGILFFIWLLIKIFTIIHSAWILRGKDSLRELTDVSSEWTTMLHKSGIITHTPALAGLNWRWFEAPPGSFLTTYGDTTRAFYWIAGGSARVLGRTAEGDICDYGMIYKGTGVGELTLLQGGKRMADVVITRPALVACLTEADFSSAASPEMVASFKRTVLASQSFDHCEVFSALPSMLKEKWISHGSPIEIKAGDTIVEEGQLSDWMALIVKGNIRVIQGKVNITELAENQIIGEMAFLYGQPRNATLEAVSDVLLWKWEKNWLVRETQEAGIFNLLERLAESRGGN